MCVLISREICVSKKERKKHNYLYLSQIRFYFSKIHIQKKQLSVEDFKSKIESIVAQLKVPVQARYGF